MKIIQPKPEAGKVVAIVIVTFVAIFMIVGVIAAIKGVPPRTEPRKTDDQIIHDAAERLDQATRKQ